jgi:hypothetical protein
MTWVAVMVVPLTVPRTRMGSPVVTALAEAEPVPFWYVVEDAWLTVIFWPPDVDSVKLDEDTLLTVPTAPPAAGPDRALDPPPPPPPDRGPPAKPLGGAPCPAVVEGDVAAAEEDVAAQPESPITAHSSAAAIHPLLLFDSNRRTLDRRACLAIVTEADQSGEDAGRGGGAAPPSPELPATDGTDVVLETGRAERVSWRLVGS